jgi:hypothetical protein
MGSGEPHLFNRRVCSDVVGVRVFGDLRIWFPESHIKLGAMFVKRYGMAECLDYIVGNKRKCPGDDKADSSHCVPT